jgi:hypothetical protein
VTLCDTVSIKSTHPTESPRSEDHVSPDVKDVKGWDVAMRLSGQGEASASPRDNSSSYRLKSSQRPSPASTFRTTAQTTSKDPPRHAALTALPSAITLAACANTTTVLNPISSARLVQASTNRSALSWRSRRVSPLREGKRVEV